MIHLSFIEKVFADPTKTQKISSVEANNKCALRDFSSPQNSHWGQTLVLWAVYLAPVHQKVKIFVKAICRKTKSTRHTSQTTIHSKGECPGITYSYISFSAPYHNILQSLTSLKYKRCYIRATIKSFVKYIDSIPGIKLNATQTLTRLAKVKDSWSESHIDTMEKIKTNLVEASYFHIITRVNELLTSQSHGSAKAMPKSEQSQSSNASYVKNIIVQLVQANESLSDVQKFYYLKLGLKGEAAECIQHLVITKHVLAILPSREWCTKTRHSIKQIKTPYRGLGWLASLYYFK